MVLWEFKRDWLFKEGVVSVGTWSEHCGESGKFISNFGKLDEMRAHPV